MANRERNVQIVFRISTHERKLIEEKMSQLGTKNMAAYLRKMAVDGYIIKLELPELRELTSLLRRYSASLNQIAKRVNETWRIYDEDIKDIQQTQEQIWHEVHGILTKLSVI